MSIARHHNEWLSLVPNSGPFLSLPVLKDAFPQGIDAHDPDHTRRLRMAFEEWDDNQTGRRPDPAIHRAWVKLVLDETLSYAELLAEKQAIPETLKSEIAEYGETLRPDWVVNDPATKKARLLVQVYPRSQALGKPVAASRWKTSPDTRMMQLLHDTGIRLGIVTNGDHWMLVNAPKNETTGYASWYANLWLEEPITLRAFRTLLCADRLFSVPPNETLDLKDGLLDRSANDQQEVTDQLGYQVRKAVEVLIQSLDKADQDHGRKLLADVSEKALYESALTVMMRLVFLFCAEERELLLLGDDLYDRNYAVSTLREQLRATADQFGEEILGLRYDAWVRLLTTFRAVYAGAKHDRLKLPAYGGSLFHPDRFTFLEGRAAGTSWKDTQATPLPVSNRTVLHLLEALQVLQVRLPGGGAPEARKLSFRELNIEQIGHVYEGLLDHTAKRATEPMLGLQGTRDNEPEIPLAELEKVAAKGEKELLDFLKEQTGRSTVNPIKKALKAEIDDQLTGRFRTACQGDELWKRVKPFAGLVRLDTVAYPVVITTGSVFVTAGTDRRSSGTHYTPRSLTEPIVQYTLEPLVYIGPAEGSPKEQWKLKSARELLALKICDMACGSGAFLVQVCRYLAARLLEAWDDVKRTNPDTVRITPEGQPSTGQPGEMLIPDDPDERFTYALRIVAQRCLFGVDKNPLAVEMAKLSLWLLTLAKNMPFEFLDHAIRHGDSLVGIHTLDQLRNFSLDGKGDDRRVVLAYLDDKIKEAIALRHKLTEMQANTVEEVEAQERMLEEANEKIDRLKCSADLLISAEFVPGSAVAKESARDDAAVKVAVHFNNSDLPIFRQEVQKALGGQVTFHWPLEFPEVMIERGGFDAFVGNPPFMGGSKISDALSNEYRAYLVHHLAHGQRGTADLCAYFLLVGAARLRIGGTFGFITTNSIAEGFTREVGLAQIVHFKFSIYFAIRSSPWPGTASLEISQLCAVKELWSGSHTLDSLPVSGITSYLTEKEATSEPPHSLQGNVNKVFKGHNVYGLGFVLQPEEAKKLLDADPKYSEVIFPYQIGADLNSQPDQIPERWVINFRDWTLREAEEYPLALTIVRDRVKPERDNNNRSARRDNWWIYGDYASGLEKAIRGKDSVLVRARIANIHSMVIVRTDRVFNEKVLVFIDCPFSVMQSTIHEVWARHFSSTLRTDMQYTSTQCFDNFPFPPECPFAHQAGTQYHDYRAKTMLSRKEGLTKTYNCFHDPSETGGDIQKLRELHVQMDRAVAAAYGWIGLNLDHCFHETKQGVRYTISEAARREVLARLLKLNHERYAEEVKQGLHDTKKKPKAASTPKPSTAKVVPTLFSDDATFPSTERDSYLCGLVCDLVAAEPGLPVSAYVDSLVIALGYKRHKRLLTGRDATKFAKLCKGTPLASWTATDKIPWAEMMNLLHQRKAIEPEGQMLQAGAQLAEVRKSYQDVAPELVALLRKASTELRNLQAQVGFEDTGTPNVIPAEKAEIFKAFVKDRDQWYGVAA
ncbi:MAG: restriction endonuclease [Planctomycetaceae bacterium]|nr:restriction endonuclease [Planctomycetaceae bacterium]